VTATFEGYPDSYYYGRRPTAVAIPSFRNVRKQEEDFMRGYMTFYSAGRMSGSSDAIGAELKESVAKPGIWSVYMMMQGETIPVESNHVRLSSDQKDAGYSTTHHVRWLHLITMRKCSPTPHPGAGDAGCRRVQNITPNDSKQKPGLTSMRWAASEWP
jgi:hypothetical protein